MHRLALCAIALLASLALVGCGSDSALHQLIEARRLSAELIAQFEDVQESGNSAVMAEKDARAKRFVEDTERASAAVQQASTALARLLAALRLQDARALLGEFDQEFAEYRQVDGVILALAVENTNVKAQRLAFGASAKAAEAFDDALEQLAASATGEHAWHEKALAAMAVANAREIQVLQAPHIAALDDPPMLRLEKRMAVAEAATRAALRQLASLAPAAPELRAANAAFERFVALNAEIVALSRRNTNVRSLALSLNEKGVLSARCEHTLHALREIVAKHALAGTR